MTRMVRVVQNAAVRHPETGDLVVPDPRKPHSEDDPLVKAYPWMFASDEEIAERGEPAPIESVAIEPATRTVRGRGRSTAPRAPRGRKTS